MSPTPLPSASLPPSAEPALAIVRRLREAGHAALLAGGCVRDLLLGIPSKDFDVATSATPDEVCNLFRPTRRVGAQFGVVLVGMRPPAGAVRGDRVWVEVATFRTDGDYPDGRRPAAVTFSNARHDAERRDFTINGMFLDPLPELPRGPAAENSGGRASKVGSERLPTAAGVIIDYVGGREDMAARRIRAIGDPNRRFAEDHLRMLRAVRFAARLGFVIEPETAAAIRRHAPELLRIAAERRLDELSRMLADASRGAAWRMLAELTLDRWLVDGWLPTSAAWRLLADLPDCASLAAAFAALLHDFDRLEVDRVLRQLAASNELRETVLWLVAHQRDLDAPDQLSLADLKRLAAHPAFAELRHLGKARAQGIAPDEGRQRLETLAARLAAIPPDELAPPPFITGEDLIAAGVPRGPAYKVILEELYTRQLNLELGSREEALAAMRELAKER